LVGNDAVALHTAGESPEASPRWKLQSVSHRTSRVTGVEAAAATTKMRTTMITTAIETLGNSEERVTTRT